MSDPRVRKLAETLVNYSIGVKPGDWVLVTGHVLAMPLVVEVIEQVVKAGGNPTTLLNNEAMQEAFMLHANDDQLQWISPLENMMYDELDALISLRATENTRALTNIDPRKDQLRGQARRELSAKMMERSAVGDIRWVLTQYPCPAYAQDADMSLRDYEDFVYGATFANTDDPVAEWRKIHDMQAKLVDWLAGKKHITVKGPNIDMTLSIEDRVFINSDGKHNMPSGEIFTGPVEESVNGWVKFTYPAIQGGREVEGVEFEFQEGKVVSAKAKKNEEYLLSLLNSDEGARYLGEFAIGTNYGIQQFTKSILYDEKIGGTLHMAVGAGYPETGSKNKSSIHWDFICDMREDSSIFVDGELFYQNGQFQV